jgi:hypothetical protein
MWTILLLGNKQKSHTTFSIWHKWRLVSYGRKSHSKFKDWAQVGGLAIVACTKELGNYHIVALNSQFHQFGGGFYAGGNKEVI